MVRTTLVRVRPAPIRCGRPSPTASAEIRGRLLAQRGSMVRVYLPPEPSQRVVPGCEIVWRVHEETLAALGLARPPGCYWVICAHQIEAD